MRRRCSEILGRWPLIGAAVVLAAAPLGGQTGILRWGGDAEGGAPFVEADPRNPAHVVGFDVEIAGLIATELGRTPEFVQITFTELDQAVRRGDFDIGLSGIEDTPARRASVAASLPYYEFHEVLTVRAGDRDRIRSLADLRGRRVGTLGGTIAYDTLLEAERTFGIHAVSYDDDVHPYTDLLVGRVDAVLLDNVLADRSMRRLSGLFTHPANVRTGYYVIVMAPGQTDLQDRVNTILRDDPLLSVRGARRRAGRPLKVIVDSRLRVPLAARCFQSPGPSLVAATRCPQAKRDALGINKAAEAGVALSVDSVGTSGNYAAKFYSGGSLAAWIKKK